MNDRPPIRRREFGQRIPKKLVLIVVEGMSEKIYFERFRTSGSPVTVRIHESKDRAAKGMVEKCIRLIERSGLDTDTDEVIAVFDADRNSMEDLEEAAKVAYENKIKILLSNPSFEFWLLLHFEDDKYSYIQSELEEKLGKHLGTKYKKSEGIGKHANDENIKMAIARSKELLPDGDPIECKKKRPSTCLHLLAEKLKK